MICAFEYALMRAQEIGERPHVTVITSCTSDKRMPPRGIRPLSEAEIFGPRETLDLRMKELEPHRHKAAQLYTGLQHARIMEGAKSFRAKNSGKLSLRIVSAGFGVVNGETMLPPYDVTFANQTKQRIVDMGARLEIPASLRWWLRQNDDLKILALGRDYLRAAQIDWERQHASGLTVMLCAPNTAKEMPEKHSPNLLIVPLGLPEARRFKSSIVSLKGELTCRILKAVASRANSSMDLQGWG